MIYDEGELERIAETREGDLAEIPFAILLHALASRRRTAVLELERPPLQKSIVLEAGEPVDCRSNLVHETLSRFLEARGDLTPEDAARCLQKATAEGKQFGEVMIEEGLTTPTDLYRTLQQNLAKKLLDCFSWRRGRFRVTDEVPEVAAPLKVNTPQLVVTGVSKFTLDDEVASAVGPLVGKRLFVNPDPPYPLADLRLSPTQKDLLALLEGGKRIDEMAAETSVPFNEIMRLIYSLAIIGLVVPEERLPPGVLDLPSVELAPAVEAPQPAAPEPAAPEPGAPQPGAPQPGAPQPGAPEPSAPEPEPEPEPARAEPAPPSAAAAAPEPSEGEHDQVMEAYLRYRKQDSFDLLGVDDGAGMAAIERAYLEFSRRFAPWKFDLPGFEDLREKAEDLFLAGGRAFGELTDGERRNALVVSRRRRREERERKPARDRFVIQSDLLDPAVQFKKGMALMRAGRFDEARQQLQFAYDCDPQNSTYRAELAYCRFRAAPDSAAESAVEELRETLRLDLGCGLAVYYLGLILGDLERFDEAEAHLRKAIKMLMPDRRPIEALKDLQARRKSRRRFL